MSPIVEIKRKAADLELVEDIQSGIPSKSRAAQATLYKEYFPVFLNQMNRNVKCPKEAEDLAIQALSKAFTQLDKYNPNYAFSTWLQSIARNLLIDFKRKLRMEVQSIEDLRFRFKEDDYEFEIESKDPSPVDVAIQKEAHFELHQKLQSISEEASIILSLRYLEELSYKEISERLNLPLGTVKVRIYRAKEELKLAYQNV